MSRARVVVVVMAPHSESSGEEVCGDERAPTPVSIARGDDGVGGGGGAANATHASALMDDDSKRIRDGGGAGGGDDDDGTLRAIERRLEAKDFIMEPDAMDVVKSYVASGGKPSSAIEALSENYRGYAAMTTLAVEWLKITAPPKRGVNTSPIKAPARTDDSRTPTGGVASATGGVASGGKQRGADDDAERFDEMYFLETIVREKFDSNKADEVFVGRPPKWLDEIFASERGRALLFSLAEENPNCLLISCAIQHAWQRGMRHEVRALGPAAAAYFSIFHELLADHIKGIVLAGDDAVRRRDAEERVKKMCCKSVGTYMFGQMMLATLARDDSDAESQTSATMRAIAARLSEEVEEEAAALQGAAAVRRIAPWLAASAADAKVSYATSDLLHSRPVGLEHQGTPSGALAVGDLKKLRDLYFDAPDGDKPSVAPLRHPDVLYNLIAEAFKWSGGSHVNRQIDVCFDLIALATSDEGANMSADVVSAALKDALNVVDLAKRGETVDDALTNRVLAVPSASAGIIAAVRSAMTNTDHYRVVQVGNTNGVYLALLADVARRHIGLQGAILEALSAIIQFVGRSHGDDLVTSRLDTGCDILAAGHVMPTLVVALNSWSRAVGPSHLLYFTNEVLEIAAPPYSRDFVMAIIRLLESANSRRGTSKTVDDFVEEVRLRRREFALGLDVVSVLDFISR